MTILDLGMEDNSPSGCFGENIAAFCHIPMSLELTISKTVVPTLDPIQFVSGFKAIRTCASATTIL